MISDVLNILWVKLYSSHFMDKIVELRDRADSSRLTNKSDLGKNSYAQVSSLSYSIIRLCCLPK